MYSIIDKDLENQITNKLLMVVYFRKKPKWNYFVIIVAKHVPILLLLHKLTLIKDIILLILQ